MGKRDLMFVIFVAGAAGFLGGFIGGTLTGDFHIYIDSFTGPGHYANEASQTEEPSEQIPGD